jgi:hypothetical protein
MFCCNDLWSLDAHCYMALSWCKDFLSVPRAISVGAPCGKMATWVSTTAVWWLSYLWSCPPLLLSKCLVHVSNVEDNSVLTWLACQRQQPLVRTFQPCNDYKRLLCNMHWSTSLNFLETCISWTSPIVLEQHSLHNKVAVPAAGTGFFISSWTWNRLWMHLPICLQLLAEQLTYTFENNFTVQ